MFRVAGHPDRLGDELVPGARIGAAGRGDGTGEGVEEEEGARHLPPALVAGGGAAPVVRGEPRAGPRHDLGHLAELGRVHAGFRRRPLEGAVRVQLAERGLERRERARQLGLLGREILLPVEPAAHEVAVPGAGRDEVVRDREQDGGLGARLRGEPVIGVGGGVRETRVEDDEARPLLDAVEDALRVRIEVVPGLEVGTHEEDDVPRGRGRDWDGPCRARTGSRRGRWRSRCSCASCARRRPTRRARAR